MDQIMEAWNTVLALPLPLRLLVGAKLVTPLLPSRSRNKAVDWFLRALNFLALNVLKDRNFDDAIHHGKKAP